MTHHSSFLRSLFLSFLFALSITQIFASSDSEKDETPVINNHFKIKSMVGLLPCLDECGIKLGPNVVVYIDNDDTICCPRFNINPEVEGDLPPLEFLSCPDLGRTYKDVLQAAATLLHGEDDSISLKDHKRNLRDAHLAVCNWNKEPWRHLEPAPLELEPLAAFIHVARGCHSPLKICSGLPLTYNKISFFAKHKRDLGFKTCSLEDYNYRITEGADYLYALKRKTNRILQDLTPIVSVNSPGDGASSASGGGSFDIDTIILIDNAPTACTSLLESMVPDRLVKIGLSPTTRVIAIQYDFLRQIITPEKVVAEYKLWRRFLEIQEEARRAEERLRFSLLRLSKSDSDDGYDTNPDQSSLTGSTEGRPPRLRPSNGELEEQEEGTPSSDLDDDADVFEEDESGSSAPKDDQKDD